MPQIPETMQAVRVAKPVRGADVRLEDVPVPKPREGWVLIRVEAFGLNHAEAMQRAAGVDGQAPLTPGLECIGQVVDTGGIDHFEGNHVLALVAGMGVDYDGSHAQYVLARNEAVKRIPDEVTWSLEQQAAFPLTYFTAWGALHTCLKLEEGEKLIIRGATSALGLASIQLARAMGAEVIGCSRGSDDLNRLLAAGCHAAVPDGEGVLAGAIPPVAKVLDLVGNATLKDSLSLVAAGGALCVAGDLGGAKPVGAFDPATDIPNGVALTGFKAHIPTIKAFSEIFAFMAEHELEPLVGQTYRFDEVARAYERQEQGGAGKIVVLVEG